MSGPRQARLTEDGITVYEAQEVNQRVNPGNPRFKSYRPGWLVQALERKEICPQNFVMLRKHSLHMSREQCAAFLRVDRHTVWQWETGRNPIPFMAYELLRLLTETMQFKFAHPEWEGWSVSRNGELCNPDGTIVLPLALLRNFDHVMRNIIPELQRQQRDARQELEVAREQVRQLTGLLENSRQARLGYAKERIRGLLQQPSARSLPLLIAAASSGPTRRDVEASLVSSGDAGSGDGAPL